MLVMLSVYESQYSCFRKIFSLICSYLLIVSIKRVKTTYEIVVTRNSEYNMSVVRPTYCDPTVSY
jgi:hypothetical protein